MIPDEQAKLWRIISIKRIMQILAIQVAVQLLMLGIFGMDNLWPITWAVILGRLSTAIVPAYETKI